MANENEPEVWARGMWIAIDEDKRWILRTLCATTDENHSHVIAARRVDLDGVICPDSLEVTFTVAEGHLCLLCEASKRERSLKECVWLLKTKLMQRQRLARLTAASAAEAAHVASVEFQKDVQNTVASWDEGIDVWGRSDEVTCKPAKR